VSDGTDVRCAGRLFQRLAAETGKAHLPTDSSEVAKWNNQLIGVSIEMARQ